MSLCVRFIQPCVALRDYVATHFFIRSVGHPHEAVPSITSLCPVPGAVINFLIRGAFTTAEGQHLAPATILGVHSGVLKVAHCGALCSWGVILTVPGMARLFPGQLGETANSILAAEAILGGKEVRQTLAAMTAAPQPEAARLEVERWLLRRLEAQRQVQEFARLTEAHAWLRAGIPVNTAADRVDITRRQLGRWYEQHIGVSPKEMMSLERLQKSLRGFVTAEKQVPWGDYGDQSHQIRDWKKRLGTTPRQLKTAYQGLAEEYRNELPNSPIVYGIGRSPDPLSRVGSGVDIYPSPPTNTKLTSGSAGKRSQAF